MSGTSFTNPVNSFLSQGRFTNTYNLSDKAVWVHGNHSVQFGGSWQKVTIESFNYANILPSYGLGFGTGNQGLVSSQFRVSARTTSLPPTHCWRPSAATLNTDTQLYNVTSRNSGYVNGAPNLRNYNYSNFGGFVTDTWRIPEAPDGQPGRALGSLYTGGRSPFAGAAAGTGRWQSIATLLDPNLTLDFAGNSVGRPWYHTSWHEFAPNLGLAWDPFGNGKTLVRAGYSISYVDDNLAYALSNSAVSTNAGLATTVSNAGLSGFISNAPPALSAPAFQVPRTLHQNYVLSPYGNAVAMPDPGLTTPYVQQWNISVEHSVKDIVLNVRYVGNHGVKENPRPGL
ncbi:MAG: hypothetical protein WDO73_12195 [Ignavibacteriota bacterium]